MGVSAVIVTLNEADKLRRCLLSIRKFASEIVVCDLGSSDNTRKVAQELGGKIYQHEPVDYVELVRNFAISAATGEWVLVLDPDEVMPEALIAKLTQIVKEDQNSVVNIPRKNIFFGKWIKHTNFWPDRQTRFFRKGLVHWPERIHAYPQVTGKALDLPATEGLAIEHYGYDNFREFLKRQQRYLKIEAENRLKEGKRFSPLQLFWQPLREFLVRFIKYQGFLDGIEGWFLVFALMLYQIRVELKMLKLQKRK